MPPTLLYQQIGIACEGEGQRGSALENVFHPFNVIDEAADTFVDGGFVEGRARL